MNLEEPYESNEETEFNSEHSYSSQYMSNT